MINYISKYIHFIFALILIAIGIAFDLLLLLWPAAVLGIAGINKLRDNLFGKQDRHLKILQNLSLAIFVTILVGCVVWSVIFLMSGSTLNEL